MLEQFTGSVIGIATGPALHAPRTPSEATRGAKARNREARQAREQQNRDHERRIAEIESLAIEARKHARTGPSNRARIDVTKLYLERNRAVAS